jgi:hypothetical protein
MAYEEALEGLERRVDPGAVVRGRDEPGVSEG